MTAKRVAAADEWQWQDSAACADRPTAIFFEVDGESQKARELRERAAKRVCFGCTVRADCLREALRDVPSGQYGVWGGLTADERRALRRSEQRKAKTLAQGAPAAPVKKPKPKPKAKVRRSGARVDATGAIRRLRALTAAGHSLSTVSRVTDLTVSALSKIRLGIYDEVHHSTAQRIADAYPVVLSMPVGVQASRRQVLAAEHGWESPLAWMHADIDDPAARPRSPEPLAA